MTPLDHTIANIEIAPHMRYGEYACRCCGWGPISPWLALAWKNLRAEYGKPITIVSGFRCAARNASLIGSSPTSRHMAGMALDLSPFHGDDYEFFLSHEFLRMAVRAGFKGIGQGDYNEGDLRVHVDVDRRGLPDGQVKTWRYPDYRPSARIQSTAEIYGLA